MFGRIKDWRHVAARYGRCPAVFFSATSLAATVLVRAMRPDLKELHIAL